MSYRHQARLSQLEKQKQHSQAFPKLYTLMDDQKLPWDAPEDCLIIRLANKLPEEEWARQATAMVARHTHLSPEAIMAEWHRPVEREAPPPHRQKP